MTFRSLLFSIALFCFACTNSSYGELIPFYPNKQKLKKGYANKYYLHKVDAENKEKTTNVLYETFQWKDNKLRTSLYSSGFEKRRDRIYNIREDGLDLILDQIYFGSDTSKALITDDQHLRWNAEAKLSMERNFDGFYTMKTSSTSVPHQDTIWNNRSASYCNYSRTEYLEFEDGRRDTTIETGTKFYAEDLGLVEALSTDKTGDGQKELVKQMSIEAFNELKNHGTQRVAFIDTSKTLLAASKDHLCNDQKNITDYYNDRPLAQFPGGKGPLKTFIDDHLNKELLYTETGMLTFRFVVNCEGVADWFITEEADRNYQRKTFKKETVEHLLSILKKVKKWTALEIKGEKRDAYVYITFKLEEGEIIELLP